jgi:hypothetical protein
VTDRNASAEWSAVTDEAAPDEGEVPGEVLVRLRVDEAPDGVPRARQALGRRLASASAPVRELAGDVKLLACELLTNAVLHGAPPVDLLVVARRGCLRVEVTDTSRDRPLRARSSADTMTGRGIALVAGLASRWGSQVNREGKVVWAEVDLAQATLDTRAAAEPVTEGQRPADGLEAGPERRYRVWLGDVSTELLLAAKSHVDNLIREFTLAAAGAYSGESTAVPPQLAELIGQVTTRFADARRMIREQALAAATAGERRTRLELLLPLSAADAGEEYLAALDVADEYARQARLLTLETPPQHRAFRHWYVSSLIAQLRAAGRGAAAGDQPSFEEYLSRVPRPPDRRAETAPVAEVDSRPRP